jgi:crotonobetainyl-CoA:carnitine CoA-transferase CaiB-like acyl-CoA transferase
MTHPLDGEVVVDLSTGIAGAYATKILADAGATVVKVEPPDGDPLRRFAASGAPIAEGDDGALFQYLACSKQSVVADPGSGEDLMTVQRLVASADGVVWSPGSALAESLELSPSALRGAASHATIVTVTPFGLEGPWAGRAANEATLQAISGSAGQRGTVATPPLLAGGRLGDWEAGLVAGLAYLISRHRRVAGGGGELVDVSALEAQCLTMVMYPVTYLSMAGGPMRPVRMRNLPAIHASRDGYVGFMVVTGQQWLDFAAMVGRPDWVEDESLLRFQVRAERHVELLETIDAWMAARSSAEIAELANAFRIPVAVLGNGATLPDEQHLIENRWFVPNPGDGFVQPDVPYTFGASAERRAPQAPPRLGEHTELQRDGGAPRLLPSTSGAVRPFAGLRIIDFCNNWAGPVIGHVFALFGADVIKVESAQRPDPLRFNTIKTLDDDLFWEWSPLQHGPNTSKRAITLDMTTDRGRELALELIATADVVVENYSPRVMDQWGLTADVVHDVNPSAIFLRAPAYGLAGEWRDRVGYAQTIEMTAGLAWVTGMSDRPPEIPNGPCDPIAGLHAAVAAILALEHRRRTGEGMLLEVPMMGGALNVAAEQVVEHSAYGVLVQRDANRSPTAAPQGTYRCADDDLPFDQGRWVLISVEDDSQWDALRVALGDPEWASSSSLATSSGRRRAHDAIDDALAAWCANRKADDIVDVFWAAGIPVAKVRLPHEQADIPQLHARGFFSTLHHPITGDNTHGGFPATFSTGPDPARLHTGPPPTLGQHNDEVLGGILGLSDEELAQLERDGVIGTRPGGGGTAW